MHETAAAPRFHFGAGTGFDLEAELAHLRAQAAPHTAHTLAKESDLRIVLVAMKPGARIQEHTAAGQISIQVLHGRVRVELSEESAELSPGKLLVVARRAPHALEALEESAFLLTMGQVASAP